MKKALIVLLLISGGVFAQTTHFPYQIKLVPTSLLDLPGLHSFSSAEVNGKWIIIGGRKDGIHARQPFNAFPAANNNDFIYVIDKATNQYWTASVNVLPTGLKEQLQSTNMNEFQDHDTLYISGGYGFSPTANDHITYPYLTRIDLNGLIFDVMNGTDISPNFIQLMDQRFAVTGGNMGKIGSSFYLIGGHRFDGRYNPMGGPTFTQAYVNGIRKFDVQLTAGQMSILNYSEQIDQVHLHRRDYNLLPMMYPNNEFGYAISSGVFQLNVDLPFLYPVEIHSGSYLPRTDFNQYLSHYHSAKASFYDSSSSQNHHVFFGGISQYFYVNGVLTSDPNVPFVKTISRLSMDQNGQFEEALFSAEMPSLTGASARFFKDPNIQSIGSELIDLSQLTEDSMRIGYIVGGIKSTEANPFSVNNTGVTSAQATMYEVWLLKETSGQVQVLEGSNLFSVEVFPNPSNGEMDMKFVCPSKGSVELFITNQQGQMVMEKYYEKQKTGVKAFRYNDDPPLAPGRYYFNFIFDDKYTRVVQVTIQ
jgi:hypothetical protein